MIQYLELVRHVLETGTRKENRTGVDTLSTFGYYYEHDLREGFPLLTTKAISWKNIVIETLWFLSGQTDISILRRHNCRFWDPWADENGKVPSAYGNFWRHFPIHADTNLAHLRDELTGVYGGDEKLIPVKLGVFNDQIRWVLEELRQNPMSRRLVVSAWAPGNAQNSKLPPCHCMFVFNVQVEESDYGKDPWEAVASCHCGTERLGVVWAKSETEAYEKALMKYGPQPEEMPDGSTVEALEVRRPIKYLEEEFRKIRGDMPKKAVKKLCLHLTQRSADVALGVPYNLAGYSFLLHLFAHMSGIEVGLFGHTLIDAHIYTAKPDGTKNEFDHVPGLRQQVQRETRKLPELIIDPAIKDLKDIEALMDPKVTTDEVMSHFILQGYDPHPNIPFKVAV